MKNKSLLVVMGVALLMSACSSKKDYKPRDVDDMLRPATMTYTGQDSANIMALVNEYAGLFEQRDFDACSQLLYKLQNDSIRQLTEPEKQGFKQAMNIFSKVYAVRTTSFILRSDKNNDVKLTVQIDENGDIDKNIGTISFSLNPVYKDGNWYLTVLDKYAEGVENIYEN